jgi:uncharacterized membrane protein YphA (DoxX/SURF4 family)
MKKTNLIFWIITGIFSAFMLFTSIPDIILNEETKTFMQKLGYPDYFTRFIGVMKVLGIIAILIPGYPKIKEWAYAGLMFDLLGATYSIIIIYGLHLSISFMLATIAFCAISYLYHHKKLKMKT